MAFDCSGYAVHDVFVVYSRKKGRGREREPEDLASPDQTAFIDYLAEEGENPQSYCGELEDSLLLGTLSSGTFALRCFLCSQRQ